ncbi:MAG: hypothetical protein M3416_00775 [Acidobacteriota bacterium]|nr:hypothetical protein [Acidobacteriota bacterium]
MTTATNRRRLNERVARAAALCLLALAATLFEAREARAQWATNGNNTSTTNNVGIGTATPSQMFHVHSGGTWAGTRVTTASTGSTINDGVHFGYDDAVGAYIWNREATAVVFSTSNTERARLNAAGSFGLGTAAPASKLHVLDNDLTPDNELFVETTSGNYGPTLRLKSSIPGQNADFLLTATGASNAGGAGAFRIYDYTANATRFFIAPATGNVGIGTTSPSQIFHVHSGGTYSGTRVTTAVTGGTINDGAHFGYDDAYGAFIWNREASSVVFSTSNTERARFDPSGNLGIGTTAPATKLHVVGDVTVTGNISAKYQDVAEWVPSAQQLAPGTVVILDPERPNHVLASTASYDTAVAGVISEKPGLALGEAGEGKTLVATTGRVKVKVDATRAPIRIGDLLVTSDRPGVAMRSEPVAVGGRKMHAPGTIIGKALEPLAGGAGEILVLLSLQ